MIAATHNVQLAQIPTALPEEKYYRRFRNYTGKDQLLHEVRKAFLDGIALFAGSSCREQCERDGLGRMHLYYPAEYVNLLEAYVNNRLKRRMLEWSAAVGRHDVGFQQEFLVQDLLVVRVHYPHSHIGKGTPATPKPHLRHRLRYGISSNLERMREAYGSKTMFRLPGRMLEYMRERRKRAALPLPYRCHAPHLDSWLGQPISALSVWLAIAGVGDDNSMCLYPETIGVNLPVSGSRFLDAGYRLPKPTRPNLVDGDLFVFTTDMLHSSQLNVSDRTRIALTTRIDPGTPVFSDESLWFVERWYSAEGILGGQWRRRIIRARQNIAHRPAFDLKDRDAGVRIPGIFQVKDVYRVAPSSRVKENEKLAVQFDNKRLLIVRISGQLRAFSARCPHGNYQMDEGYHDACALTCPGHGLDFDIRTGESALKRYRLAMFNIYEKDGTIFLGSAPSGNQQA